MSTLGEKALELIRESVRARDILGAFNEEKVRAVLEEIKSLFEEVTLFNFVEIFGSLKVGNFQKCANFKGAEIKQICMTMW